MQRDRILRIGVWTVALLLGLLLVKPAIEARANPPRTIEYKGILQSDVVSLGLKALMPTGKEKITNTSREIYLVGLNQLGRDGWEYIGVSGGDYAKLVLFKR